MAILDKLLGVGEAVRDKYKETFGDPTDGMSVDDDVTDDSAESSAEGTALDVTTAYSTLGLGEGANLADVREAYRALAKYHHPMAQRDGPESDAQRALDKILEALELLEEHLVPLSGSVAGGSAGSGKSSQPPPRRKRATARKR